MGHGSHFWFTLSLARSSTPAHHLIARTDFEGLHVCLVDDNSTNLSILQYYTQRWGMRYEPAWNGHQALALLKEAAQRGDPFDVAIVDYHMPEMDGMELAKQIKSTPYLTELPLILLTSGGARGETAQAKEAGFSSYLRKPIRLRHLSDSLGVVLGLASKQSTRAKGSLPPMVTQQNLEEIQTRGKQRILLAEDNLVNQKVAVKMLSKLGYQTDIVANGQEALTALAQRPYDLILMDCQMPEMDGFEATREIRERETLDVKDDPTDDRSAPTPQTSSHIPIIAVTANAMAEDREKCLEAGMDDFLSKPVKITDLEHMLEQWLPQEEKALLRVESLS